MGDLRIDRRKPPVNGWITISVTHTPTGTRLDSVHFSREYLIELLGLVPAVRAYYEKEP